MNREELAAETEYNDLLEALADAKASGDSAAVKEAKNAVQAFRQQARANRVPDAAPDDGVAAPETVQVTTEGG